MDIGFIGLGAMGSAIARNLVAAGHRVRAWNRSGGSVQGPTMRDAASDAVDARMGDAIKAGWGDLDWSAMADFTIERGVQP